MQKQHTAKHSLGGQARVFGDSEEEPGGLVPEPRDCKRRIACGLGGAGQISRNSHLPGTSRRTLLSVKGREGQVGMGNPHLTLCDRACAPVFVSGPVACGRFAWPVLRVMVRETQPSQTFQTGGGRERIPLESERVGDAAGCCCRDWSGTAETEEMCVASDPAACKAPRSRVRGSLADFRCRYGVPPRPPQHRRTLCWTGRKRGTVNSGQGRAAVGGYSHARTRGRTEYR